MMKYLLLIILLAVGLGYQDISYFGAIAHD